MTLYSILFLARSSGRTRRVEKGKLREREKGKERERKRKLEKQIENTRDIRVKNRYNRYGQRDKGVTRNRSVFVQVGS